MVHLWRQTWRIHMTIHSITRFLASDSYRTGTNQILQHPSATIQSTGCHRIWYSSTNSATSFEGFCPVYLCPFMVQLLQTLEVLEQTDLYLMPMSWIFKLHSSYPHDNDLSLSCSWKPTFGNHSTYSNLGESPTEKIASDFGTFSDLGEFLLKWEVTVSFL